MKGAWLALLITLAAGPVLADTTLYKSVGPNGQVIYSDQPAPGSKPLSVPTPISSPLSPEVLRYREGLEQGLKKRLQEIARGQGATVRLFTAQWCGYCRQARAYLSQKSIRFEELDVESPAGQSAYTDLGGVSGVPVLTWKGQRLQGYSRASYDDFFQRLGP